MLEDRAGNMWVGVDEGLYLFKNSHFHPVSGPNRETLGLVVGLTEDVDGDIWAECFSKPPKLVRIRDFQVREEFPASISSDRPHPRAGSARRNLDRHSDGRPCAIPQRRSEGIPAKRKGRFSYPPDYPQCRRLRAFRLRGRLSRDAGR